MTTVTSIQSKNELNGSISLNYNHTSSIFHAADGIEKRPVRIIGRVACAALAAIAFIFETLVNLGRLTELSIIWVKNRVYKPVEPTEKPAAKIETPQPVVTTQATEAEIETLPPIPVETRIEDSHKETAPQKIVEDENKPIFVLSRDTAVKLTKALFVGGIALAACAFYFNLYPFTAVPLLVDGSLFTA